jgi:glycosyltransferase involved in cell wall biosynthesis
MALNYSGHVGQLTTYSLAAQAFGHSVTVHSDYEKITGFDVVHHYGCAQSIGQFLSSNNNTVVTSANTWTTYVNDKYASRAHRDFLASKQKIKAIAIKCGLIRGQTRNHQPPYANCDAVIANSIGEQNEILSRHATQLPIFVVPNIVSSEYSYCNDLSSDGVLFVGRIEPHKNQLGFLKAVAKIKCRATLIGVPHGHHSDYCSRVFRLAEKIGVTVLNPMPASTLAEQFARHKLHVLPSWYESTGLVSLEAAVVGCNVIHTKYGYGREYLGDLVTYCDPGDERSLRNDIELVLSRKPSRALSDHIVENFSVHNQTERIGSMYSLLAGMRRRTD